MEEHLAALEADEREEVEELLEQAVDQVCEAGMAEFEDICNEANLAAKLQTLGQVVQDVAKRPMPMPEEDIRRIRLKAKEEERETLRVCLASMRKQEADLETTLTTTRQMIDEKAKKLDTIKGEVQKVLEASKVWEGRNALRAF